MDVRTETIAAIPVARVRHVGPYAAVGPSFERLFGRAHAAGAAAGRVLTPSHDDPEAVPPEELRSDAGIELLGEAAPDGIVPEAVGAGRYAVYTDRGRYGGIAATYRRLLAEGLPGSGEAVDDRPWMEVCRNSPPDTPEADLVTDLHLPLRAVCHDRGRGGSVSRQALTPAGAVGGNGENSGRGRGTYAAASKTPCKLSIPWIDCEGDTSDCSAFTGSRP